MSTYRDVITQAMQELGVLHVGETPSGDEGVDGLTRLNQLMTGLIYDGIDLEFQSVTNIDSDVPYPDDHIGAFASMLALELTTLYGVTASQEMVAKGLRGKRYLQNRYLKIPPATIDPAIRSYWNPNNRFV